MTKTLLPDLSPETTATLSDLRANDKERLYDYVKALRTNGWPLRSISKPLGVSHTIVSVWESKSTATELPQAEPLPELPRSIRPVYQKYTISEDEEQELYNLAREASKVRRYTDQNSPYRKAAEELEDKLHFHQEQGASLSALAEYCGVTRRAIAQRLEKRK